jgi:hypothetical protein
MEKDKLKDITDKAIKFLNENDIAVFFGSIDENILTEVSWTENKGINIDNFLATVKKTDAKIIVVDISYNDIDEDLSDFKESLEDEELIKEFEDAISIVRKTKGQIVDFTLSFFHNNVCYSYYDSAEWFDEYEIINDFICANDEEDEVPPKRELQPERLGDDKIEELARKIISIEKYINAKNPLQRSEIADSFIKQENLGKDLYNIYTIKRKAESLFETEIRPKQEEEIKKKVLELKSQNFKKVEIASKLNISSGMVNKFYYTENQ